MAILKQTFAVMSLLMLGLQICFRCLILHKIACLCCRAFSFILRASLRTMAWRSWPTSLKASECHIVSQTCCAIKLCSEVQLVRDFVSIYYFSVVCHAFSSYSAWAIYWQCTHVDLLRPDMNISCVVCMLCKFTSSDAYKERWYHSQTRNYTRHCIVLPRMRPSPERDKTRRFYRPFGARADSSDKI